MTPFGCEPRIASKQRHRRVSPPHGSVKQRGEIVGLRIDDPLHQRLKLRFAVGIALSLNLFGEPIRRDQVVRVETSTALRKSAMASADFPLPDSSNPSRYSIASLCGASFCASSSL